MNFESIARLHRDRQFGMSNGGWAYDAYPELPTLDAGRSMTIAAIEGPAIITQIHSTQHLMTKDGKWITEGNHDVYRGIALEIYFDDVPSPAVCVPLADFFADGCNGRGANFGSYFVEKAPGAYNCYIPIPFAHSARVVLRNDTSLDLMNYSFVEFERLPRWDDSLGYFHATWRRDAFQLHGQTDQPFFHVDGCGHLLGRAWSIATDEALFDDFTFVMEGNNEVRIDGDIRPTVDYLGTEDSFGFSWGFRATYAGPFGGMNYIHNSQPSLLSIYRFRKNNTIRFQNSLDWRINWSYEWTKNTDFQRRLAEHHAADQGWVDYATTFYWYQEQVGYPHAELPELPLRTRTLLHPNVS
jgi:hypothetical protein